MNRRDVKSVLLGPESVVTREGKMRADVSGGNPLHFASKAGHREIVDALPVSADSGNDRDAIE